MADLIALQRAGERIKMLFFWSHEAKVAGAVGPECLSQWYGADFEIEGELFRTAEHWMMAEKARIFGDDLLRREILEATHPGAAKKLGRHVRGFDEAEWVRQRFSVVVAGNSAKFSQNPKLGNYLRTTWSRVLVEASPRDAVWGVGLAADDERAHDPAQWQGLNLLGFALMVVRERLQET